MAEEAVDVAEEEERVAEGKWAGPGSSRQCSVS